MKVYLIKVNETFTYNYAIMAPDQDTAMRKLREEGVFIPQFAQDSSYEEEIEQVLEEEELFPDENDNEFNWYGDYYNVIQ